MIKKNIILKVILPLLIAAAQFYAPSTLATSITIAGGSMKGSYYPVALQICSLITKYSPISSCQVVESSGAMNNLSLLNTGKVDFAFIQSDLAKDASLGRGAFHDQKPYNELRQVLSLYPEILTIISRKDSGILTIQDLSDKKLGLNLKNQSSNIALGVVMDHFTFSPGPTMINVNDYQMLSMLCESKNIDALVLFLGHPNPLINAILARCEVEFVSIDPVKLDEITQTNHIYKSITMSRSLYKNLTRDINTLSALSIIGTNITTEKDKVDLLVSTIVKNFDEFQASMPILNNLKKDEIINRSNFCVKPY